jgi:uncharacterized protein YndB with AHSA1/START domain
MAGSGKNKISVSVIINSPVSRVWNFWIDPVHIIHWNNASDDWLTTYSENDVRPGGKFLSRMEARDGSAGFDFTGEYEAIELNKSIDYTITGGRCVQVIFGSEGDITKLTEIFEAEDINAAELQQAGWQAILDNFKKYVENYGKLEVLNFKIIIDTPLEKVFKLMLEEDSYKAWTSVFNPSSRYKGTWEKRSKMVFLGNDKDGKTGGMVSRIRENIPDKFLSIEHTGIIQNGKEITAGPEVDRWKGSLENYSYTSLDGKTILSVSLDSDQEFKSYFIDTWPRALEKLKSICEQS